jgi:hypothetical protein
VSWRASAQRTIRDTMTAHAGEQLAPEALLKLVNAAYPFGQRKHLPYKVWLEELHKLRVKLLGTAGSPITHPCPACGAKPGRPCKPIGPTSESDELHAARRQPDHGPLFAVGAEP